MPGLQNFSNPSPRTRRYRVKDTGETGSAVSSNGAPTVTSHMVTIGDKMNIQVVDLCIDNTGEIRTYLADRLDEISE